ncbi:serine hydrolase domain-containing protein [Streptomyces sp. NPDC048172]|uniref:serine hydrolase domain-containing protein n=1 Tax=Streptomyces sp. NPDC048172 TaxID=3365505 RepID=UPI00371245DF
MPRRTRVIGAVCAAAAALTVSAAAPANPAHAAGTPAAATDTATDTTSYDDTRRILRRLTTTDGAPGALAEVDVRHRGRTAMTSGVADVTTRAPMAPASRFRVGSMTKTFTATVVLQLVGEHRIALDVPVERYLPGVIRGNGNDGRDITVRQLLQQTSGLPDFLEHLTPQRVIENPFTHYEPEDLVGLALDHPRQFEPGTEWKYSNTNYIVAGMLIEKVTGNPYGTEIERRVIQPLGLHDTSVPGDDPRIPGTHPRGYVKPPGSSGLLDRTAYNPTVGGSAGGMISSGRDINRFYGALLDGRLLRPAELRAMKTTRPTGNPNGRAYGLGLESLPLPCGGLFWGHTGDSLGFQTAAGATRDGRRVTAMANLDPGGTEAQDDDMDALVTTALCEAR